jgi:hypothetical protein
MIALNSQVLDGCAFLSTWLMLVLRFYCPTRTQTYNRYLVMNQSIATNITVMQGTQHLIQNVALLQRR